MQHWLLSPHPDPPPQGGREKAAYFARMFLTIDAAATARMR
jgi:hypothetical protein